MMTVNFLGQNYYISGTNAKKPKIKLVSASDKKKAPRRQFKTYDLKKDNADCSFGGGNIECDLLLDCPVYDKKPVPQKTKGKIPVGTIKRERAAQKRKSKTRKMVTVAVPIATLLTASALSLYSNNTQNQKDVCPMPVAYEQAAKNMPVSFETHELPKQIHLEKFEIEEEPDLKELYNGAFDFEFNLSEEHIKGLEKFMKVWNNPKNRARYEGIAEQLGIPAEIVAINHYRETNGDFTRSQVDGHLLIEEGFNNWEESALYAYQKPGINLDIIDENDINTWYDFFENYNGYGYRKAGIKTPYVWSGTDLYTIGKYDYDGHFNETLIDNQAGAAIILRELFIGDVLSK